MSKKWYDDCEDHDYGNRDRKRDKNSAKEQRRNKRKEKFEKNWEMVESHDE